MVSLAPEHQQSEHPKTTSYKGTMRNSCLLARYILYIYIYISYSLTVLNHLISYVSTVAVTHCYTAKWRSVANDPSLVAADPWRASGAQWEPPAAVGPGHGMGHFESL